MTYSIKEVNKHENSTGAPEDPSTRVESEPVGLEVAEEAIVTEAVYLRQIGRKAAKEAPTEETRAIFAESAIAEARYRLELARLDLRSMHG